MSDNASFCIDDADVCLIDSNVQEHFPFGGIRISSSEVLYALLHLNVNKGSGPDNIPSVLNKVHIRLLFLYVVFSICLFPRGRSTVKNLVEFTHMR